MKLPDLIQRELDDCGLPWSVEPSGRGTKIVVDGKIAGCTSRDGKSSNQRQDLNVRAQIMRIVHEARS